MRIGLDIDNVIANFDKGILEWYIKEDKNKRNAGIINPNAKHITKGMFDWSQEEVDEFFNQNMETIASELEVIPNAKEVIDKLMQDGHEIYLITHRVYPHYKKPYKTTFNWLKNNNIKYTKLILSRDGDKTAECKKHKIDVMIDDRVRMCREMTEQGINCYVMLTKYTRLEKVSGMQYVKDWNEIYDVISELNKPNVILDTDMFNEIDDQFALCYLIKNIEKINLQAITIAPFSNSGYSSAKTIKEGLKLSYDTTLKILDLLNYDFKDNVFLGSENYFKDATSTIEATNKIIEIARKNNRTTIVAIGAITNVALALNKAKDIIDKVEVIWLGGNSFLLDQNKEFNFMQDVEAVRDVYNSKVKLTVIPCKNVASNLATTTYEIDHYLKDKGELGEYLCKIFKECKQKYYKTKEDQVGVSKTLWDLSAIAYVLGVKGFVTKKYSCPKINNDTSYKKTYLKHKITFVNDLSRKRIYNSFFNSLSE